MKVAELARILQGLNQDAEVLVPRRPLGGMDDAEYTFAAFVRYSERAYEARGEPGVYIGPAVDSGGI